MRNNSFDRGLRNRYRTPGIGAALAASEPLHATADKQSMRIRPRLKIPVTAFLRLDNPRAALASGRLEGKLEFYTQDSARTLKIEGVSLAALTLQRKGLLLGPMTGVPSSIDDMNPDNGLSECWRRFR